MQSGKRETQRTTVASDRLAATPGVKVESVDVGSARLQYDPAATNIDDIEEAIADEGYTAYKA